MANILMTGNPLSPLLQPISDLDGAGPKLTAYLTDLVGGGTLLDLVLFMPRRWVHRKKLDALSEADVGQDVILTGLVTKIETPFRPSAPFRIRFDMGDNQEFSSVYFRADRKWLANQFPEGMWRSLSGKLELYRDAYQLTHPEKVGTPDDAKLWPLSEPIYGQSANLSQKRVQAFVRHALNALPAKLTEWIDAPLLEKRDWPSFSQAIRRVHGLDPATDDQRDLAMERLAYDEAVFRGRLLAQAHAARARVVAKVYPNTANDTQKLLDLLPFSPTGAQRKAHAAIAKDLASGSPMRRLVQGDVGSGKTLVGGFAALQTLAGGGQVAFMAPTELLARQQYETLSNWFTPLGYSCAILTGKDSASLRHATKIGLVDKSVQLVVGTHALFQKDVEYNELGLVIIDELHRFGVSDREKLRQKGHMPHILVMSATPIPRSIAQILHGDLDVTILDEKPAGRQDIDTRILPNTKLPEMIAAINRAVKQGEQAYWVCPRLETDQDKASVIARAQFLQDALDCEVSLVHGQLSSADKQQALGAFRTGTSGVLVATTVIEVGVDVPSATIMVIENAEGFGLAQLHQLRGRVGRGSAQSYCLLMYTPPLTTEGRKRLEILRESNDGFVIAEKDFQMRGPGDILGVKQSGDTPLRFLDPRRHQELMKIAQKQAQYEVARHLEAGHGFAGQEILRTLFGAREET